MASAGAASSDAEETTVLRLRMLSRAAVAVKVAEEAIVTSATTPPIFVSTAPAAVKLAVDAVVLRLRIRSRALVLVSEALEAVVLACRIR